MRENKKMKRTYLKYILALILFGSNGIVASFINLSSYEIVLLRTLIGSLLLIVIFLLAGKKFTFYKHQIQFVYLIISGIAMGTSWIFLYEVYHEIGVSIASLTYYCGPIIVMIASPIVFKEKLTLNKVMCFGVVLLGLFLVNGQIIGECKNILGLFCGFMSAIMYSIMIIFNKKASEIKELENPVLQLFMSFLTVAIFTILKQGFSIQIKVSDVIPIFILGIFNTGIGCYFYFSSINKLHVQTVAICGYLEPLSAVIFSAIFLNEIMLPIQIIGAICIIGGAMLGEIYNIKIKKAL